MEDKKITFEDVINYLSKAGAEGQLPHEKRKLVQNTLLFARDTEDALAKVTLAPGMKVTFRARDGQPLVGTLQKVNRKSANVAVLNAFTKKTDTWRVSIALLSPA